MYADITAKVSINADQGVSRRSRASVSGADGDAAWDADAPLMAAPEHTKNNLSTLNGCYVPCLLNILGAVLFLRIGFSVGQLGLVGTLGIFLFSEGIAYLTITSFSAIVTNGRMKVRPATQNGTSSTDLAMGFANVRAGTRCPPEH